MARTSGAAIVEMIFGPSRTLLPMDSQKTQPGKTALLEPDGSGEAQPSNPASVVPTDDLGRVESLLDPLGIVRTPPPPLTRELTMIEKQRERERAGERPKLSLERQRQLSQKLDLEI